MDANTSLSNVEDNTIDGERRRLRNRNTPRLVSELTEALSNLKTGDIEEPEVVEGHVVGGPGPSKVCQVNMPDPPAAVNFEDENGVDDAGAFKDACAKLDRLIWNEEDLPFFISQVEIKLKASGVKNNFTKFQALSQVLPPRVQNEVKSLLVMQETDFPNGDAYKKLKHEVIRIFGPRPEASFERALGRTLTDKPSMLARALVNDVCKRGLNCPCCPSNVLALWKRSLPLNVRAGIAHASKSFSKDNFNEVTQLADDIFAQTSAPTVNAMRVAAVAPSMDETLPALEYPVGEVNAMARGRGGRGFRGGRNRGRGRGNRGGSGSSGSGAGGQQQPQQTHSGPRQYKGTKHPDLPPGDWTGCQMHFRWGRQANFCTEPSTCPWRNVFTPKQNKN